MKIHFMDKREKVLLIQALEKMLLYKDNRDYTLAGLCMWANCLHEVNLEMYFLVKDYIKDNPPGKWSLDRLLYPPEVNIYYWKTGAVAPRVRWLKRHIKLLSKSLYYENSN